MSDSDLDLEQDEQLEQFQLAAKHVAGKAKDYNDMDLLELYGLYKQATEGVCRTPKPNMLQMRARTKWSAWHNLGEMSQLAAQRAYVEKLQKMDPKWLEEVKKSAGRLNGWAVHSIESKPDDGEATPDHLKTLFDHVKEQNLARLQKELQPSDLAPLDEQGMALLHWATDRNAIEIIEFLVQSGANVNQLDAEQQTPLHYASSCGHVEAVACLLRLNADLELRDACGQSCLDVAADDEICGMLRAESQKRKSSPESQQ